MAKKQGQKSYFKVSFGPIQIKWVNALQVYTISCCLLVFKMCGK